MSTTTMTTTKAAGIKQHGRQRLRKNNNILTAQDFIREIKLTVSLAIALFRYWNARTFILTHEKIGATSSH